MKLRRFYKVAVTLALVLAVATSLWFASPTQAFNITFPTLLSNGYFGSSFIFEARVEIAEQELLPIQNINMYIYKADDRASYQATAANLPLGTTSRIYGLSETSGGVIGVYSLVPTGWGYTYGYGYATWQGSGYSFFQPGGYGYGYQGGAWVNITYTVDWISPSDWPAGSYVVELVVSSGGNTFTRTSSAFSMGQQPAAIPTTTQIEQMALTSAAAAVQNMTIDEAKTTLENLTLSRATDILGLLTTEKAADTLAAIATSRASALVENLATESASSILGIMPPAKAGDILDGVTDTKAGAIVQALPAIPAVNIIQEVSPSKGAGIIENITVPKAVEIVQNAAPSSVAAIMDLVSNTKGSEIIQNVTNAKAAEVLQNVTPNKAAGIMQGLTTDKLANIIPSIPETSLANSLPGLTPEKLYSIDPKLLFNSLPNAPREQLVSENPPKPPAGAGLPATVFTTPNGAEYLAIQTWSGEWVVIVATPPPVEKLMVKTKQATTNAKTKLEVFDKAPVDVTSALPAGLTARAYLTISLDKALADIVEVGHIAFKVEKNWLTQNSVHKWSVMLYRFDPETRKWMSIPTKRVSEDDTFVHYTASINQFSSFAIVGSKDLPGPSFSVANLAVPATGKVGEPVNITFDVSNLSGADAIYPATLWVNGTIESGKNVALKTGETRQVTLTAVRSTEGTFDVRVDRLTGTFKTVKAPVATQTPASFTVSNLSISPDSVDPGKSVLISVLVANSGEASGTYKLNLMVNNVLAATMDVNLSGKSNQTVTFSTSRDTAGSYSVEVNGLKSSFTVKGPATPTTTTPGTEPAPFNGWLVYSGIIVAVIAIAAVVFMMIRRSKARRT